MSKQPKPTKIESETPDEVVMATQQSPDAEPLPLPKAMDYVIVRTHSAGVFAGYLGQRNGMEAIIFQARRIWYWDGAASLSQLSIDGVGKPENCKFPAEVPYVVVTQVIEILPCTEKAKASIAGVKIWKA